MNIYKELWQIANTLDKISSNYDSETFVDHLKFQVEQLSFFYNFLVPKQGNNPAKTFYAPKKRPKEHQVAYFNLTRGFPKELHDPHWCYILKDFGTKFVVIPTTSVKTTSAPCNPTFEYDITIKDFINSSLSRLHIDDIRVVDLQRMIVDKGFYDVESSRDDITSHINNSLLI